MKKFLSIVSVIACASVYCQTAADGINKLQFSKPDILPPLKVDFSYYSKNYDKVFGEFNFTRDANNVSPRSVYVGYGDTFYYQGNSTYINEIPNYPVFNYAGYQDVVGGLKNLASLFTAEKDYSVKQK